MVNVFLYPGLGEKRKGPPLSRKENKPGKRFFLPGAINFLFIFKKYRHFFNNFETNPIQKDTHDKIL
jgi:hypothetical protein